MTLPRCGLLPALSAPMTLVGMAVDNAASGSSVSAGRFLLRDANAMTYDARATRAPPNQDQQRAVSMCGVECHACGPREGRYGPAGVACTCVRSEADTVFPALGVAGMGLTALRRRSNRSQVHHHSVPFEFD